MTARRVEPLTRTHTPGEVWLSNGRKGLMTCSGLVIGRHHVPRPPAQEIGSHAEHMQRILLHRRPLAWDQMMGRAQHSLNRQYHEPV